MSPAYLCSSPAGHVHAATVDTFLLGKGPKALEVCLHVCINLCVCVCVYVCSPAAPVCMYADVSAYTTSCCVAGQGPPRGMSICTYISTFVCECVHVCVLARACVCVCVVCAQKHTNKHTHTRTHTHTHLHTHTHTGFPNGGWRLVVGGRGHVGLRKQLWGDGAIYSGEQVLKSECRSGFAAQMYWDIGFSDYTMLN